MPIIGITASASDSAVTVHSLSPLGLTVGSTLSLPLLSEIESGTDIDIRLTRDTVTTSGTTQDFEVAAFGTPKGAIFVASTDQSDGLHGTNTSSFCGMAIGATDGTNSFLYAMQEAAEPSSAADLNHKLTTSYCGGVHEYGTKSGEDFMDFNAWSTNGVTLNKDSISRAFLMTTALFKGSDLDFAVGTTTRDGIVNTLSFAPNYIMLFGVDDSRSLPISYFNIRFSVGFARNTGSGTEQFCQSGATNGSTNPVGTNSRVSSTCCAKRAGGDPDSESVVLVWGSNGFELDAPGDTTDHIAYIACRFGGGHYLNADLTPTATGAASKTGLSFQPGFRMTITTAATALNTAYYSGQASPMQICMADGTNEYTHAMGIEDGAGSPVNTWTAASQSSILCYEHDETKAYEASFTSFNSDGWTDNYTTQDGTAYYILNMAVECN